MNPILLAVIIVAAIGLIAGLGLSIASKVFAVPVDEKAEAIRECLPGANCGACGFSGCDGYAAALSNGETTDTALCAPGGNDTAKAIGEITGLAAGEVKPTAAVVLCLCRIMHLFSMEIIPLIIMLYGLFRIEILDTVAESIELEFSHKSHVVKLKPLTVSVMSVLLRTHIRNIFSCSRCIPDSHPCTRVPVPVVLLRSTAEVSIVLG